MKFVIVSDVLSNIKTTTVLFLSIASACTLTSPVPANSAHFHLLNGHEQISFCFLFLFHLDSLFMIRDAKIKETSAPIRQRLNLNET